MSTLRTNAVESITGTATDFPNSLKIQGTLVPSGSAATEPTSRFPYVVGSVAELEAASLPVGQSVQLTEDGRAGEFVVKAGVPPSDPQKGIYIALANGNFAERQLYGIDSGVYTGWFGAVADWNGTSGTDNAAAIQAALDFAALRKIPVFQSGGDYLIGSEIKLVKENSIDFTGSTLIAAGTLAGDQVVKITGREGTSDTTPRYTIGLRIKNETGAALRGLYIGAEDPLNIPDTIGTTNEYSVHSRTFEEIQLTDCYLEMGECWQSTFRNIKIGSSFEDNAGLLLNGQNVNIIIDNSMFYSGIRCQEKNYTNLGSQRSEGITLAKSFVQGDIGLDVQNMHSSLITECVIDLNRIALRLSLGSLLKFSDCFLYGLESTLSFEDISAYSALTKVSFDNCQISRGPSVTDTILLKTNRYLTSFVGCSISGGSNSAVKFSAFGGTPAENLIRLSLSGCSFSMPSLTQPCFDTNTQARIYDSNTFFEEDQVISSDKRKYTNSPEVSAVLSRVTDLEYSGSLLSHDYVYGTGPASGVRVIRMVGDANTGYDLGIGLPTGAGGVGVRSVDSTSTGSWQELAKGSSGFQNARPSGVSVGYMFFDRSLEIPTWWDGTNWVDATGAAV